MRPLFVLPLAILAAGCSSEKSVTATNASVADVQNQVEAAGGSMQMRPGRWEGTMTVRNAAAPGTKAAEIGQTESRPIKVCVTADQVKPGNNPFIAQMQQGCKYDHFKLADGKIDAAMTCARPGVTLKNKINGAFTDDTYRLTSLAEVTGDSAGPLAGVKSESTIEAKRTGDCRGDENGG